MADGGSGNLGLRSRKRIGRTARERNHIGRRFGPQAIAQGLRGGIIGRGINMARQILLGLSSVKLILLSSSSAWCSRITFYIFFRLGSLRSAPGRCTGVISYVGRKVAALSAPWNVVSFSR